jgi:hypothetical protein
VRLLVRVVDWPKERGGQTHLIRKSDGAEAQKNYIHAAGIVTCSGIS